MEAISSLPDKARLSDDVEKELGILKEMCLNAKYDINQSGDKGKEDFDEELELYENKINKFEKRSKKVQKELAKMG